MGGPSAKVCSSAKCCVLVFKASMLYLLGVHLPKCVHLPSAVYWYSRHLCSINGASICQSRFVCQVWCSGIQGIYSQFMGGPSAKACSSAKCCVLVFKASMLYLWGVHLPKCVHLPSAVYWYSRHLCSINGASISQSRFICQVWCSGIQGIYALFTRGVHLPQYVRLPSIVYRYSRHSALLPGGGAIGQRRFVCQI